MRSELYWGFPADVGFSHLGLSQVLGTRLPVPLTQFRLAKALPPSPQQNNRSETERYPMPEWIQWGPSLARA